MIKLPKGITTHTEHESNIMTTLSIADELLLEYPVLKQIIHILAWGAYESIDEELLSKILDKEDIELYEPLALGVKLKIINKDSNDEYILHRLVREVWRAENKADDELILSSAKYLAK